MLFYIIRHADPNYEKNTITPEGHREAEALAVRMARENLTRIYTSPMGRARETARYTEEATAIEAVVEDWTLELPAPPVDQGRDGRISPWHMAGEIIRPDAAVCASHDGILQLPYLEGNPIADLAQGVRDRSDLIFAALGYQREGERYRCVQPNQERIALFCHGEFGKVMLSHLLGIPLALLWCGLWLAPTSVTTVYFEERSEEWAVPRCVAIGDTGHLYAAGLPVRPRGILGKNWQRDPRLEAGSV
jgi:probable phosphoglycerate mutase